MNFMQHAIESAGEGVLEDEGGPFGACIVKDGKVIAVAHNTVLKDHDPTCHAEMNAIRMAAKALNTHVLAGCELYTTAEPCPMCLSAIYWANIDKLYIGAPRSVAESYGFRDKMLYDEMQLPYAKRAITCVENVMAEECEAVFNVWKQFNGKLY